MHLIRSYLPPLFALALFAIAFYPSFSLVAEKWSASDDYTHAFFTVPIILFMFWQKRQELAERGGNLPVGSALFAVSLLFYILALQIQVPTIIFLATVAAMISSIVLLSGVRSLGMLVIPLLLLFMIIPIPNQLFSMLTATLQLKVSAVSEVIINLLRVPIFREGNVLHVPGKTFQVVEACSGIRSLISMTTLSLIIGHFTLERGRSIALLFLSSIPVAIVINVIRVVGLVAVYSFWNIDLTYGTPHTVFGVLLFLFGLALLFLFQRILERWEA